MTGNYVNEPVFAEVVREARRLGYTLVPYEITREQNEAAPPGVSRQQHRDRSQALNLRDRIFRSDPDARVIVHAGYSHILEEASDRWYPMALYFKEATGIDPVTVDQTRLSERSDPAYEHPAYRAALRDGYLDDRAVVLLDEAGEPVRAASFAVDLQVLTPRTRYEGGRPTWMRLGQSRLGIDLDLPECRNRWCYVAARKAGEPDEAVPLDRTEVTTEAQTARLFLPVGQPVEVRVYAEAGDLIRTFDFTAPRP